MKTRSNLERRALPILSHTQNIFVFVRVYIAGCSVGAIMHADIILLSPSVSELQTMINVCCTELCLLDIKINSKKSSVIRIGNRYKVQCADLWAANEKIVWAKEAKYLGVYIVAGLTFKCNFDKAKIKYYRAASGILEKIGNKDNSSVSLKLISSIALPVLLYSIETVRLNKSELLSLNHPRKRTFQKIFHSFDSQIIMQCHFFTGYLPVLRYYCMRSMSLLRNLSKSSNLLLKQIYEISGHEDICRLASLLNCNVDSFAVSYETIIRKYFSDKLSF
jgi:hypothetical protein